MNHRQQTLFSRRRFCALRAALPVTGIAARGTAAAHAADEPPAPPPTAFEQLFPHPSGKNGYEDIVRAADAAKGLPDAGGPRGALTQKRVLLALPQAQQTLGLLRRGLNRGLIQSPLTDFDPTRTYPPHYTYLRSVARLLVMEQYVLMADGKTGQAVDSWFDGLRLGAVLKSEGSVAGPSIESLAMLPFARRMEVLSARDCDRVIGYVRKYLAVPDPAIEACKKRREREFADMVGKLRRDPLAWAQFQIENNGDGAEQNAAVAFGAALRKVGSAKGARDALVNAVEAHLNDAVTRSVARLRDPAIPPAAAPTPAHRATPAYHLAHSLTSWDIWTDEQFQIARTQTQLAGVTAAIYRFRWERNRLPETLDDLAEVGVKADFVRDPFTGKPLVYKKIGEAAFELSSAGLLPRTDDGYYVPTGERQPVTVSPMKPRSSP